MPLRNWLGLLILGLMICLPIFAHLESDFPIMLFDEGRQANNAIEMYETGDLIVTTYDYQPDLWNTKPPLLVWMQTLCLKVFGIRDLSIRLPIAIAAVLTCVFIYFFARRKMNAPWLGIIACAVLICAPGYVRLHGIRTGDYDGLLTLFTTVSVLCFYLFIESGSKKYFWWCVTALILGCLSKGIAGLLFVPAMVLYAVFKRKLVLMLKNKEVYLAMLAFVVFVIGYYLLREVYDPGYISAVLDNEVGGRYSEGKEGHAQPLDFYFHSIFDFSFQPFIFFLFLGVITAFISRYREYRGIVAYLLLCCVGFLLAISGSTTKHSWYVIPMLPLLAIISAVPLYITCKQTYEWAQKKQRPALNILSVVFLALVLAMPLRDSVQYAMNTKGEGGWHEGAEDMGRLFQKVLKTGYPYDQRMKAVFDDWQGPQKWYMKAFRQKGIPVTALQNETELRPEELVITYNDSVKAHFKTAYDVHVVEERGKVMVLQVHGRR
jgi:4-amino-4-deoxy-L-arabinose transferase-like glycosyltransferase